MPGLKVTSSPGQHLNFVDRKKLVARLALAIHLNLDTVQQKGLLRGNRKSAGQNHVIKVGQQEADNIGRITDDDLRLDCHLAKVVSLVEQNGARKSAPEEPIAALKNYCRGIKCQDCGDGSVCSGKRGTDNELVTGNGLCIKGFTELFDFVFSFTDDAYRKFAHGYDSGADLDVIFFTRRGDRVSGETKFDDGATSVERRKAKVFLYLPIDKFWINDYLRLVYSLMHEVFVHAAERVRSGTPRIPMGEACPVAEGMIDSAAYLILKKALTERNGLPENAQAFAERFANESKRAHDERYDFDAPRNRRDSTVIDSDAWHSLVNSRRNGRDAFGTLVDLASAENLTDWPLEFALSVNLADLGKIQRIKLVSALLNFRDRSKYSLQAKDLFLDFAKYPRRESSVDYLLARCAEAPGGEDRIPLPDGSE